MTDGDTEPKRIKSVSRIRRIVEQGLGHLFIASVSSHFYDKTVLEEYLIEATRNASTKLEVFCC